MDLRARDKNDKTLDEVLDIIKKNVSSKKRDNVSRDIEVALTKSPFMLPSVVSDPKKYIKEKVKKTEKEVEDIYKKLEEYKKITNQNLKEQYDRHKGDVDILDVDNLYLKGRRNKLGLLDEHAFLGELDCKSRVAYCFTDKKLSKECFKIGNKIHDLYILPCKLKAHIKKLINIIENQDIDIHKNRLQEYLEKTPKTISKSLVIFGFTSDEIDIIYNSDEKLFKEYDENNRGIYMRLLLKKYQNDINYLKEYIESVINNLIVYLEYSEVEAIEKAILLLKTLILESDEAKIIDKLFVDQRKRLTMFSSDSEGGGRTIGGASYNQNQGVRDMIYPEQQTNEFDRLFNPREDEGPVVDMEALNQRNQQRVDMDRFYEQLGIMDEGLYQEAQEADNNEGPVFPTFPSMSDSLDNYTPEEIDLLDELEDMDNEEEEEEEEEDSISELFRRLNNLTQKGGASMSTLRQSMYDIDDDDFESDIEDDDSYLNPDIIDKIHENLSNCKEIITDCSSNKKRKKICEANDNSYYNKCKQIGYLIKEIYEDDKILYKDKKSLIIKKEIETKGTAEEYITNNLKCNNTLKKELLEIISKSLMPLNPKNKLFSRSRLNTNDVFNDLLSGDISSTSMGYLKYIIINIHKSKTKTYSNQTDLMKKLNKTFTNIKGLLEQQFKKMLKLELTEFSKYEIFDCFIQYLKLLINYDNSEFH